MGGVKGRQAGKLTLPTPGWSELVYHTLNVRKRRMRECSWVRRRRANTVGEWSCRYKTAVQYARRSVREKETRESQWSRSGQTHTHTHTHTRITPGRWALYLPTGWHERGRAGGAERALAQYAGAMRWLHVSTVEQNEKKKKIQWRRRWTRARSSISAG